MPIFIICSDFKVFNKIIIIRFVDTVPQAINYCYQTKVTILSNVKIVRIKILNTCESDVNINTQVQKEKCENNFY